MKNKIRSIPCVVAGVVFVMVAWSAYGQYDDTAEQSPTVQNTRKPVQGNLTPIEQFSVQNADVRSVLKQLSEYSGVDIVLHEKVAGNITLSVTHKTWKEILAIVCKIAQLTPVRESSYIFVVPSEDYQKEQLSNATAEQQEQTLGTLKREVIQLKNVPAEEMKASIGTLLSTRGKITVVQHNNALIIFDTEDNIASIKKTIKQLDVETDQVSISCKIIQVSSSVLRNLGVQWGYFDQMNGTAVSAQHLPGTGVLTQALERATYGVLGSDKFSLTLEYLFQNSKTEVVAQPQITTLDNKEAKIFMGSQVPVTYRDESFNTVVKMIDAGTELTVTPHITGDKRLMLDLKPKKSSYTMVGGQPVINEQSAATNVVVTDGETVVIAGLTSNETVVTDEGIPILKDIPLIGNLFKRSSKSNDKNDLIVFVTPHIISKKVDAVSENATSAPQKEKSINAK
ncbi:MAG: secretin N-terminal domain-containing protein [Chitinivibrionales bacterium]